MKQLRCLTILSVFIVLGTSCAYQLQQVTSGRIGCPPEAIKTSDYKEGWNISSWKAECKGKTYFCSHAGQSTECKPAAE